MGNNYDIILIGLVAVFLILRLRSVLGKRTGNERPPARDPFTPPAPPPVSRVPSIGRAEPRRPQREADAEPADHSHLPAFLLRPVRARV